MAALTNGDANTRKRKADEASLKERVDDKDKPRGRPRKNGTDESAAERRRTQIRLAQRAYRARKETTIDELRERVTELTSTIEIMNRSLRDFAQSAVRRGLPTQTKVELDNLLRGYSPHVASAREASSSSPEAVDVLQRISAVSVDPSKTSYINRSYVSTTGPVPVELGLGYSMIADDDGPDTAEDTVKPSRPSVGPAKLDIATALSFPSMTEIQPNDIDLLTEEQQIERDIRALTGPFVNTSSYETALVPRTISLSPQTSISSLETSFARRLQRRCTEVAYQLLVDQTIAPLATDRIFALQLNTGRDRNLVKHSLRQIIGRSAMQHLDSQFSPFANVGGAGTHYPDASASRRKELQGMNRAMDVMASRVPGLEGEWLDPADVEGYLREQGIQVDARSEYIKAKLPLSKLFAPDSEVAMDEYIAGLSRNHSLDDIEPFHRRFMEKPHGEISTRYNPFARPPTPGKATHTIELGHWNSPVESFTDLDLGSLDDMMSNPALNMFSIPGISGYETGGVALGPQAARQAYPSSFGSTPPSSNGGSLTPPGESRGTPALSPDEVEDIYRNGFRGGDRADEPEIDVTIDVEKLMKVLMLPSVCLGRSAGFRRKTVDMAVRNSVVMT